MHLEYNYKYDCIVDPYTYSGTAILRNKFNIRDSSVLSKVERRITEAKLVLLQTRQLPRGHYDLKHLQAMHKYLFGDIYDWAGEIRSAGFISKGQSIFCHSDFIVPYAQSLFSRMHREDFKGMTKELFVVFFWCKQNYSKDDHSFWLPHSRLQEKPTCSQVGFLWLMQNSG